MILDSGTESLEHDKITGALSLTSSTIIVSVVVDDWFIGIAIITTYYTIAYFISPMYKPSSYAIIVRTKE